MIQKLNSHDVIGLDVDQTLINNPNSPKLWQYIKDNPQKAYHIITFRSGAYADYVWRDLKINSNGVLDRDMFAEMIECTEEMHYLNTLYKEFIGLMKHYPQEVERFLKHYKVTASQLMVAGDEYLHFKGKACAKLGCTVLVDDMVNVVLPGCVKYGIELIDSYKL